MRSKTINLSAAFLALPAIAGLSACESSEVTYCGDEHRYVVEATNCESDSSTHFIYWGYWSTNVQPGAQLSQDGLKGRVSAADSVARTKVGLPARGGFGGNGAAYSSGG